MVSVVTPHGPLYTSHTNTLFPIGRSMMSVVELDGFIIVPPPSISVQVPVAAAINSFPFTVVLFVGRQNS